SIMTHVPGYAPAFARILDGVRNLLGGTPRRQGEIDRCAHELIDGRSWFRGIETVQGLYYRLVNIEADRLWRFVRNLAQAELQPFCLPGLAAPLLRELCLPPLFGLQPLEFTLGFSILSFAKPVELLLLLPTQSKRFEFVLQADHLLGAV